mgnify:FL=1
MTAGSILRGIAILLALQWVSVFVFAGSAHCFSTGTAWYDPVGCFAFDRCHP